jgi:hypothetical protein
MLVFFPTGAQFSKLSVNFDQMISLDKLNDMIANKSTHEKEVNDENLMTRLITSSYTGHQIFFSYTGQKGKLLDPR